MLPLGGEMRSLSLLRAAPTVALMLHADRSAVHDVETLMLEVYGDWRHPQWWPKPLPQGEAGESPNGKILSLLLTASCVCCCVP